MKTTVEKNIEYVTYTVRLNTTYIQSQQLHSLISLRNTIWNKLLTIKQDLYQVSKYTISKFELDKRLTLLFEDFPELKNFHSKSGQVVSKQIDQAYEMFFTKRKQGDLKANPPNIVDLDKPTSVTYNQSGWKIRTNNRIKISKVDDPIEFFSRKKFDKANIKSITVKFRHGKWLCDITIEKQLTISKKQQNNKKEILFIDLGLKKLGYGIDTKGNVVIINNKAKKKVKYFNKQIKKVNEKLSTKQKDSREHKRLSEVRRELYRKQVVQVEETLHIQSNELVNMNYREIIVGDLSVSHLVQIKNNKYKNVRKSFQQSSISTFIDFLKIKGKRVGIKVEEIDERWTTQTNCLTMKKFDNKVELGNREVMITDKIVIDRDLNSAIVLSRKYLEGYVADKEGRFSKRSSQNLVELTPPLNIIRVLEENNLFKEEVSRPDGREGFGRT